MILIGGSLSKAPLGVLIQSLLVEIVNTIKALVDGDNLLRGSRLIEQLPRLMVCEMPGFADLLRGGDAFHRIRVASHFHRRPVFALPVFRPLEYPIHSAEEPSFEHSLTREYSFLAHSLENREMTAEELIERLRALPPETLVLVEGYETGFDAIVGLKAVDVFRFRKATEWDGEYQTPCNFAGSGSRTSPATVIIGRRGTRREPGD